MDIKICHNTIAIKEKYLWTDLTTLLAVFDHDDNLFQRVNYTDTRSQYKWHKMTKPTIYLNKPKYCYYTK
ncbi:MAG: hypothetical protein AUK54_07405 [Helicobacteraceae bacterium CG2_30_36_10]|nr:MAG: hypothetical protein AUK54_07405 [Helicobacteraceae bacterium CG2_30_36_10]